MLDNRFRKALARLFKEWEVEEEDQPILLQTIPTINQL